MTDTTTAELPTTREVLECLERELRAARALLAMRSLAAELRPDTTAELLEALALAHDQLAHALELVPQLLPVQRAGDPLPGWAVADHAPTPVDFMGPSA